MTSPPAGDTAFSDARIKHLEFIQAVVARLATDSFLMKGWALTVAGAVYAFAAGHRDPWVAAIGFMPAFAFWFLDAYFVRKERQFRALYDDVREPGTEIPLFSMNINACEPLPSQRWTKVILSITLWPFYGLIVAVGGILVVTAAAHHEDKACHAERTASATSSLTSSDQGSLGGQMLPMWSPCHRGTR
jgi:hypothetical protein